MDRLTVNVQRQCRCIDDTLLYDDSIQAAFFIACNFVDLCCKNGVTLNLTKFKLVESEVEFVGFGHLIRSSANHQRFGVHQELPYAQQPHRYLELV